MTIPSALADGIVTKEFRERDGAAHLYVVAHPGMALPLDTVAASAIGSGGLHASISLTLGKQGSAVNFSQTVYNVYEAKVASEVAPGVGKATDIAVLNHNGVTFIDEDIFSSLALIHQDRPALGSEDVQKLNDACKGYHDEPDKAA